MICTLVPMISKDKKTLELLSDLQVGGEEDKSSDREASI